MVRHVSSHRRSASGEIATEGEDKTVDSEEDHKATGQRWYRKKPLLVAIGFVFVLGVIAIGSMSRAGGVLAMLESGPGAPASMGGVDALPNSWSNEPETEVVPPPGKDLSMATLPDRPEVDPEQVARAVRVVELRRNLSSHVVRSFDLHLTHMPCRLLWENKATAVLLCSLRFKKHVNRVPSHQLHNTFLIHESSRKITTPTYEACEDLCRDSVEICDIFIWMGNSPGLKDWRNRCTLRMSVHTLWDPASISLEFQYDTYTGVREHDS